MRDRSNNFSCRSSELATHVIERLKCLFLTFSSEFQLENESYVFFYYFPSIKRLNLNRNSFVQITPGTFLVLNYFVTICSG